VLVIQLARPAVVLAHLERELATAARRGARFGRGEQRSADTSPLERWHHCQVVDVQQWPRVEGREAEEARSDAGRLPVLERQQHERLAVLA
jgi:hypothetical protein